MNLKNSQEGYLQRLERHRREAEERRREAPRPLTLAERIEAWWQSLPTQEQRRAYDMEFFKSHFGESPARIGPALFALGWERMRVWEVGEPHRRVWKRNNSKAEAITLSVAWRDR